MKCFPLMVSCVLLAACGQTGPLYLPDQAPPKRGLSLRPDTHSPADETPPPIALPAKPVAPRPAAPAPAAASSVAQPPAAPKP